MANRYTLYQCVRLHAIASREISNKYTEVYIYKLPSNCTENSSLRTEQTLAAAAPSLLLVVPCIVLHFSPRSLTRFFRSRYGLSSTNLSNFYSLSTSIILFRTWHIVHWKNQTPMVPPKRVCCPLFGPPLIFSTELEFCDNHVRETVLVWRRYA